MRASSVVNCQRMVVFRWSRPACQAAASRVTSSMVAQ
jgi:hypothetical protein